MQTAADEVTFCVEGNAQIVGIINGDINSDELTAGWSMVDGQWSTVNSRRLFNGSCTVILRSTRQPGPVTLTATAKGFKPVKLSMMTQ